MTAPDALEALAALVTEAIIASITSELARNRGGFDAKDITAAVLAAITAEHAIVKLPKQTVIPFTWAGCLAAFQGPGDVDPVSAWPSGRVVTPDDIWMSSTDARLLAAALLAAARAKETRS